MENGIRIGDRLQLAIDDMAFGGDGVGRWQGLVVFVPFVLPGEEVEVEVIEVKRAFARARLLAVERPSPDRVAPRCPYFGVCGGCQYQHVRYPLQLDLKQRQVIELLRRVGGFADPPVARVVPCPVEYGYRNRIMVRSQWNKPEQRLVVGYLHGDSRLVVDVESCAIAEPALNRQLAEVRRHPPPRGGLKVELRVAPEGWTVDRDSFFQNNFHLLPALTDTVRQRLRDSGVRHLIDAYCGVGYFGIEVAAEVESFVGVELDLRAVAAARSNAAARGCGNGEFVGGDAVAWLPGLLQRFPAERTAVILDPPRRGCPPVALDCLREVWPGQILYVSCHPATLARDLGLLCRDGTYRLVHVTPLDMFPQTQHLECVADLRRSAWSASASLPGSPDAVGSRGQA